MAHIHEHNHCECCSHEHEHHHEHNDEQHGHDHEHNHEHHHHHEEGGLKKQLMLIGITVILLAAAMLAAERLELETWQQLLIFLVPYLLIGHETLHEAAEGLAHGDWFNEHFLRSVATIGALGIGFLPGAETEFPEAVFVMLFFQVGELFEGYAEGKSRESIAHLMNIRPDGANLLNEDGNNPQDDEHAGFTTVPPETVAVGQTILIRPGEKVPLDGVVVEGSSSLNTVALTGESLPREITVGDEVASGCVNLSGVLKVRVTKPFGESTVARIINLVEHAGEHKSKSEAFITRFARVYTPVVVCAALALAVVPTLWNIVQCSMLNGQCSMFNAQCSMFNGQWSMVNVQWIYRALLFLVVSCPCALVISVPLTFFAGIGGASRNGILVKGANYMDVLAKVGTVVFDKTGTLTHGQFAVTAVHPDTCDERQLLHLAAHVEHFSTHPIGAALREAFPEEATDGCQVADVEEVAGQGIRARILDLKGGGDAAQGRTVCVGNTRMMDAVGASWHECHHVGTIIHVAIDGEYAGHIVINDKVKEDSAEAIAMLGKLGVSQTVMLTGDRKEVAEQVARELHLSEFHAELLPADKVEIADRLLASRQHTQQKNPYLAFVGDGINDAPVLARADVGIAMGGLGSDAAIEAADVVLMDDKPVKVAQAIKIARRTLHIANENVYLAIGIKVAVLVLAVFGLATMGLAVFADVGVTVLAVLNAMRAMKNPSHFGEGLSLNV